jgi:hypothetical protein
MLNINSRATVQQQQQRTTQQQQRRSSRCQLQVLHFGKRHTHVTSFYRCCDWDRLLYWSATSSKQSSVLDTPHIAAAAADVAENALQYTTSLPPAPFQTPS